MNQKQIRAAVEAMLFACGDPIGADKLAQAVQLPQGSGEAALEALQQTAASEHPLAACHENGVGRLHPPPAGQPPLGAAGACRHGDSDRHRL